MHQSKCPASRWTVSRRPHAHWTCLMYRRAISSICVHERLFELDTESFSIRSNLRTMRLSIQFVLLFSSCLVLLGFIGFYCYKISVADCYRQNVKFVAFWLLFGSLGRLKLYYFIYWQYLAWRALLFLSLRLPARIEERRQPKWLKSNCRSNTIYCFLSWHRLVRVPLCIETMQNSKTFPHTNSGRI